jgi:hypothetical protein
MDSSVAAYLNMYILVYYDLAADPGLNVLVRNNRFSRSGRNWK